MQFSGHSRESTVGYYKKLFFYFKNSRCFKVGNVYWR